MKKFLILSVLYLAATAQAQDMTIMKGGQGFLFPDFNEFTDPAHLTMSKGSAIQAKFAETQSTSAVQEGNVSFATSNGRVGFGAYGDASGASITDFSNTTQKAGAELAFDLVKDRVSLGVSYNRTLSSSATNDGTINGSMIIAGSKGTANGVALAIGAGTDLNAQSNPTQTATIALGYAFKENNNIEADVVFNDWSNLSDYTAGAFLTLGSQMVYFGVGAKYAALTQEKTFMGRIGLNLGKAADISAYGGYDMKSGSNTPTYGGALRFSF